MPHELTTEQWTQLLSVLSLDSAIPFYAAMQFPIKNYMAFQKTLRNVIIEARKLYSTDPNHIPPTSKMLLNQLDATTAKSFSDWAENVFLGYHAEQPDWSTWDIVFSHWAYSRSYDLDSISRDNREFVTQNYRSNVDTDDIKHKAQKLMEKPLSDWDIEIYDRQGFGSTWESGPYSTVEAICRIERLKKFVRELFKRLTEHERQAIFVKADALVKELKIWLPGPLVKIPELLQG